MKDKGNSTRLSIYLRCSFSSLVYMLEMVQIKVVVILATLALMLLLSLNSQIHTYIHICLNTLMRHVKEFLLLINFQISSQSCCCKNEKFSSFHKLSNVSPPPNPCSKACWISTPCGQKPDPFLDSFG